MASAGYSHGTKSAAETGKELPAYIDEGAEDPNNSEKEDNTKCTETAATEAAGKTALSGIQFKCSYFGNSTCEECEFKATKEGLSCHIMNDHEPKDVFKQYGLNI